MTCRRTRDIVALGGGARARASLANEQAACQRRTRIEGPRTATSTARARRDVDDQHDAPPRPGKAPRTTATTQHDAPPRESPATAEPNTSPSRPFHRHRDDGDDSQHTPRRRRRRRLNTTQRTQRRQGVKTTHRRDDGDDPTLLRSTKQLPWSHYIR